LVKDLERTPRERRRLYVALYLKLLFVIAIGLAWAGFSLWLSLSWIDTLGQSITLPLAIAVILGIAIIRATSTPI
jgi:TRAP-type C4-dicarboxylate transport system permease small subunit